MILLILLTILSSNHHLTLANFTSTPQNTLRYDVKCTDNGKYKPNSLYQFSLYNLLGHLTSEASRYSFHKGSYGQWPHHVYALYLCHGDTDSNACSGCVNAAKDTILKECSFQTGAMIWYPVCMVCFSNQSYFGQVDVVPRGLVQKPENVTGNQTARFALILGETMNELMVRAATGRVGPGVQGKSGEGAGLRKKFATKEVNVTGFGFKTLYVLAQCTPDLAAGDCRRCLRIAIGKLYRMVGAAGARVVQPSCCARYETMPFFNQTDDFSMLLHPKGSSKGRRSPGLSLKGRRKPSVLRISLFITCSVSITVLLGVSIWIYYIRRLKAGKTSNFEMNDIRNMDSLQFDLNTIRAATRNFAMDNKLGEGGFGEVYKGILEDGEEVAIKRLSKNSGQGIKEFKTEVVLVAKLQHKNLVKLLGFCLASTEKLLLYEFLRNSSLDQVLFDATKKEALNWEIRFKLIVGIARGLLYLHEDSQLKIVHRDLKPSNILLDEGMNPKISDFDLAKLFGGDQTQDDTKRIVGTYGYMAPEYAMTGHFSVKSDVYSFGIIVLEIVSGQRNRFFGRRQTEEALLHRAWRLWNESKALELVDIALRDNYPSEEVTKCIHIALLCIQENAAERPRMATVVATLNGQSISIPMPKPPSFFGNNTTTPNDVDHNNSQLYEYGREYMDQHGYPYVYSAAEMITDVYSRS